MTIMVWYSFLIGANKSQLVVERRHYEVPRCNTWTRGSGMEQTRGEGGVNRFLRGELVILEPPKPKLLEFVGTISVSAVKEFVAKKKFVINIGDNALVKVSYLGDNFREQFLGKIEKSFPDRNFGIRS